MLVNRATNYSLRFIYHLSQLASRYNLYLFIMHRSFFSKFSFLFGQTMCFKKRLPVSSTTSFSSLYHPLQVKHNALNKALQVCKARMLNMFILISISMRLVCSDQKDEEKEVHSISFIMLPKSR